MKVLAEAHDYFVDLYNALKLTLDYSSKKSIATCGDKNISILIYRLHRCLICLGDIERYTITYSDTPPPKTKDFLPSEKYYERAAFILPASGVPHNQLATVARLQTNQNINQRHDFNIMYRFCRSILCGAPCSAGKVNLEKQYGIMISDIASFNYLQQTSSQKDTKQTRPKQGKSGDGIKKVQDFFLRFLCMNAQISLWSKQEINRRSDSQISSDSEFSFNEPINVFMQMPFLCAEDKILNARDIEQLISAELSFILEEYDQLISSEKLGDMLLWRMIVVMIYTVHTCCPRFCEALDKGDKLGLNGFEPTGDCSTAKRHFISSYGLHGTRSGMLSESLALSMIFGLVIKSCTTVSRFMEIIEKKSSFSTTATQKYKTLLPSLCVFADWGRAFPVFLKSGSLHTKHCKTNTPLQNANGTSFAWIGHLETRTRGSLRAAFTNLKAVAVSAGLMKEESSIGTNAIISSGNIPVFRERLELRGFLPLQPYYETVFTKCVSGGLPPRPIEEKNAAQFRLIHISQFILGSLIPTVVASGDEEVLSGVLRGIMRARGSEILQNKSKYDKDQMKEKDTGMGPGRSFALESEKPKVFTTLKCADSDPKDYLLSIKTPKLSDKAISFSNNGAEIEKSQDKSHLLVPFSALKRTNSKDLSFLTSSTSRKRLTETGRESTSSQPRQISLAPQNPDLTLVGSSSSSAAYLVSVSALKLKQVAPGSNEESLVGRENNSTKIKTMDDDTEERISEHIMTPETTTKPTHCPIHHDGTNSFSLANEHQYEPIGEPWQQYPQYGQYAHTNPDVSLSLQFLGNTNSHMSNPLDSIKDDTDTMAHTTTNYSLFPPPQTTFTPSFLVRGEFGCNASHHPPSSDIFGWDSNPPEGINGTGIGWGDPQRAHFPTTTIKRNTSRGPPGLAPPP